MCVPSSAILVLVAAAGPLGAQVVVDPGMSKAQVVAKLGAPLTERSVEGRTYLFYSNKIETRVGMHDLVVLDDDRVVDAIFRAEARRYTGRSSSPTAIPPVVAYWGEGRVPPARRAAPPAAKAAPASPPAKRTAPPKAAPAKTPPTKPPARQITPTKPPPEKKPGA
jgi:hypothetical protein